MYEPSSASSTGATTWSRTVGPPTRLAPPPVTIAIRASPPAPVRVHVPVHRGHNAAVRVRDRVYSRDARHLLEPRRPVHQRDVLVIPAAADSQHPDIVVLSPTAVVVVRCVHPRVGLVIVAVPRYDPGAVGPTVNPRRHAGLLPPASRIDADHRPCPRRLVVH